MNKKFWNFSLDIIYSYCKWSWRQTIHKMVISFYINILLPLTYSNLLCTISFLSLICNKSKSNGRYCEQWPNKWNALLGSKTIIWLCPLITESLLWWFLSVLFFCIHLIGSSLGWENLWMNGILLLFATHHKWCAIIKRKN
jgi:hypothetical protein